MGSNLFFLELSLLQVVNEPGTHTMVMIAPGLNREASMYEKKFIVFEGRYRKYHKSISRVEEMDCSRFSSFWRDYVLAYP